MERSLGPLAALLFDKHLPVLLARWPCDIVTGDGLIPNPSMFREWHFIVLCDGKCFVNIFESYRRQTTSVYRENRMHMWVVLIRLDFLKLSKRNPINSVCGQNKTNNFHNDPAYVCINYVKEWWLLMYEWIIKYNNVSYLIKINYNLVSKLTCLWAYFVNLKK